MISGAEMGCEGGREFAWTFSLREFWMGVRRGEEGGWEGVGEGAGLGCVPVGIGGGLMRGGNKEGSRGED